MSTLVQGFDREVFDAQAIVFKDGDSGDAAYVIESGCVEILASTGDGQRRIAMLTEGAMFGEVALLDRHPRTATVRALVPTTLVRINRPHVEELLSRTDPVIQYLMRLLLERFRSSSGKPTEPAVHTPAQNGLPVVDLHAAALRTLSLAHDLSGAIDHEQLELFYQPIVLLEDLSVIGFEALIRWRHPTMGMVSPDEFIPLAEKTGLIHRIGLWVLQRATADWARLRKVCNVETRHKPFMSVNLSAPELCGEGIVQSVCDSAAAHQMDMAELRVELTETVVISNLQSITSALEQLRGMGAGIALDDFGTGFAGLTYLQTLPFSCIKIDRAFVQQMHGSERSFQIVKSALELARLFGMTTVAEGIEEAAIGASLADMGCTYAQGFHYYRPMPLKQVLEVVPAGGRRPAPTAA